MVPGMVETDDMVDVLLSVGSDGTARDTVLTFPSSRQMYFQGGSRSASEILLVYSGFSKSVWHIAGRSAISLGCGSPRRRPVKSSP